MRKVLSWAATTIMVVAVFAGCCSTKETLVIIESNSTWNSISGAFEDFYAQNTVDDLCTATKQALPQLGYHGISEISGQQSVCIQALIKGENQATINIDTAINPKSGKEETHLIIRCGSSGNLQESMRINKMISRNLSN